MTVSKQFKNQKSYIYVFNVDRGLSIFIRAPHNFGILYDLGSSSSFSPIDFLHQNVFPNLTPFTSIARDSDKLSKSKLAQLVLSHPHVDHISEIERLRDGDIPYPSLLTCPHDNESQEADESDETVDFSRVCNDDNATYIETYRECFKSRRPPLQTICGEVSFNIPHVEFGLYYMRPPEVAELHAKSDQDYVNGLSLVLYYRHGRNNIIIPGDITPEVFANVINGDTDSVERRYTFLHNATDSDTQKDYHYKTSDQRSLEEILGSEGLSVLVPPHHGLKSGYCDRVIECLDGGLPKINVISEKTTAADSPGGIDDRYRGETATTGLDVDVRGESKKRYSISTASNNHILIVFDGNRISPSIYMRENAEDLLEIE